MDAGALNFTWSDHTGGGYTVIRVRDITSVPYNTMWVTKRFQIYVSRPAVQFNFDSCAAGPLHPGHSYQWRVDRFNLDGTGRPFEGARSRWSTFVVESDE